MELDPTVDVNQQCVPADRRLGLDGRWKFSARDGVHQHPAPDEAEREDEK